MLSYIVILLLYSIPTLIPFQLKEIILLIAGIFDVILLIHQVTCTPFFKLIVVAVVVLGVMVIPMQVFLVTKKKNWQPS